MPRLHRTAQPGGFCLRGKTWTIGWLPGWKGRYRGPATLECGRVLRAGPFRWHIGLAP